MGRPRELSDRDYEEAAKILGCDVPIIKAFAMVESTGYGFWQFSDTDWRPKILFEAFWFSQFTGGKYDQSHPRISSPKWDKSLYLYGKKECQRLDEACALDRKAGLKSASWGKFQIMGFNYSRCGYEELQDFINDMYRDETGHLRAFIGFVSADKKLLQAIKNKDYRTMALRYNGSGQVEAYASKIQSAYETFAQIA